MAYLVLKTLHIIGATILFGTGLGIAFFLFIAVRSRNAALIAGTLRTVVIADFAFTAPAVVAQLVTGGLLAMTLGIAWTEPWLIASLALYMLVGLCWLPVVGIQVRMRKLAERAVAEGTPLPDAFARLYRVWFTLGWPAFVGVIAIVALMVFKP